MNNSPTQTRLRWLLKVCPLKAQVPLWSRTAPASVVIMYINNDLGQCNNLMKLCEWCSVEQQDFLSAAFKSESEVYRSVQCTASRLIHTYSVCSAFTVRIFLCTHVNGSERSHYTRLRSGSAFQERCVCSSAAIVSAPSLFLLCSTHWIKVTALCSW